MKDAARLLGYFAATILLGALLAPPLFWAGQWLAGHSVFPALAKFDFETYFHRALLLAAIALAWPLLRTVRVRTIRLRRLREIAEGRDAALRRPRSAQRADPTTQFEDPPDDDSTLGLEPNQNWLRDVLCGFLISAVPLLCCGAALLMFRVFSWRLALSWPAGFKIVAAAVTVPIIEEAFFRGLLLGILLRSRRVYLSIFVTSALYSIVHFLKAPERTSTVVTWASGFSSIAHSFSQFADPALLLAAFTTLFLIGWVLADARLSTHSLWLPMGMHGGWIFANGLFNKVAHHDVIRLPWLGKNLLVGIVPLLVVGSTWVIMRCCLKRNVAN